MFEKFEHTFDIKSIDKENRIIQGAASLEVVDRDNEIIALDALSESLGTFLKNPVIRFKHQDPIGRALVDKTFVDYDKKAFWVTAFISDATQTAKDAWGLIKDGVIKSFSIGGKVLEKEAVKQGDRELHKITKMELYEVSVVDIPSNRESFFEVISKSLKQENKDKFVCPYCDQEFDSEDKLREHKAECPKKSADQDLSKQGAGTHSDKWDRCVREVRARGGVESPEAVCTAALGEESFRSVCNCEFTEKDMKKMSALIDKIYSSKDGQKLGGDDEYKNKTGEEKECLKKKRTNSLTKSLRTSLLTKLRKS